MHALLPIIARCTLSWQPPLSISLSFSSVFPFFPLCFVYLFFSTTESPVDNRPITAKWAFASFMHFIPLFVQFRLLQDFSGLGTTYYFGDV